MTIASAAASALAAPTASAQVGPLPKGYGWFVRNGVQVKGVISDQTVKPGDQFHLATYQGLNYTSQLWEWRTQPAQMGSMPWGRWVSSPADMPPKAGENLATLSDLSIGDEPNLNDRSPGGVFDQYVAWFNSAHANPAYDNVLLWLNNYGGQVSEGPPNNIQDFITAAHPDLISFDTYPYQPAAQPWGGSPTNWYGDLRKYRQYAWSNNTPLGIYRQTYGSPGGAPPTRHLSESELRLQTFAGLAFNAKQLADFTYNFGSSSFFSGGAGDVNPTPMYAAAAQINAEVRNLSKALVRLTPVADTSASYTTGIMFVRGKHDEGAGPVLNALPISFVGDGGNGSAAYSEWTFAANDPYLSGGFPNGATNLGTKNNGLGGDVIVSWFKPLDEWFDGDDFSDERYLMVVNGLADMNGTAAETRQTITLDFNNNAATQVLQKLDRLTGQVVDVPLPLVSGKRRLILTLDGGTGELLKFKSGAPFVGTMPDDSIWTNGSGGTYSTGANWDAGVVPAASRLVHFGSTTAGGGPTYAVNFTADAAATGVFVHRDAVTWNLAGRTFAVGGFNGFDSFVVGMRNGETASLTINNGAATVAANGSFGASIGKNAGATGTLTLGSAASFTSAAPLFIGKAGTGTFNVNAGANAMLANAYVGGNAAAAGGIGVMNVSGGTTTVTGTLRVWNSGPAAPGGSRLNLTGGTLTVGALETSNNPARVNWTAGHLAITGAPLTIGSGGPFGTSLTLAAGKTLSVTQQTTVNSGSTLAVSGGGFSGSTVLNVGTFNHTAGALAVSGTFNNAGGVATFNADAGSPARTLNLIASAGTVTLNASQHVASVAATGTSAITLAANGSRVIVTDSVSAASSGRIDLKDNKLIVKNAAAGIGSWNGSAYTGVTGLIDSGRGAAGMWDGGGIVTSMTTAIGSNDFTTLGVATAGQAARTTFLGESVSSGDVLLMFTWGGDTNLDGKINIDDYGQIDFNVGSSGSVFGWYNGDFNYDGKINIDDYGIIDFNVTAQDQVFPTAGSPLSAAAVPEPSLALAIAALSLLRRRRRPTP